MFRTKLKVRKWGNSFGTVIPKNIVKRKKLKDGSSIEVLIPENKKINLEEIFGTFKFKKSTKAMKDEIRRGW